MKTKSEEIFNGIYDRIKRYINFIDDLYHETRIDIMSADALDPIINNQIYLEEKEVKYFVNQKIKELQKTSLKENYYFFDCSFKVYKNHYHRRKIKFIANNTDVDEADFIKEELQLRANKRQGRTFKHNSDDVSYHSFIDLNISIKKPEEKKIEFLITKLNLLGWDAYLIDDEDGEPSHYYFEKNSNYRNVIDDNSQSQEFKASLELNDFICSKILEIKELHDVVGEDIKWRLDEGKEDYLILHDEREVYESEVKSIKELVEKKIEELYYKSIEDNFYFFDCPLQVYKNTVDKRYAEYKDKFVDGDASDFLEDEIYKLQKPNYYEVLLYNNEIINYSDYTFNCRDIFSSSNSKKIDYLQEAFKNRNDLISDLETNFNKEKGVIEPQLILQTEKITDNKVNQHQEENTDYPKDIFISHKHYQYYMDCLKYLNAITEDKIIKRGFSAIAHAVFKNKNFQDYIFKVNTPLKNYIKFLTEEFNFNKTSRLSDHSYHESSVSRYTSDFDIKELSNKKE